MTILLYGLLGGTTAVAVEALMRRSGFVWHHSLWWIIPTALVINWSIYKIVVGSPSLVAAIVVFGASTLGARIAVSLWMGYPIGAGTWLALPLMLGALLLRMWRP